MVNDDKKEKKPVQKRPKYGLYTVTHRFADGTVINRPLKEGEVMIPAGNPFYDWYARMLDKYGGEDVVIQRKTPDGEPLILAGDLIDFGLKKDD